MSLKLPTLNTCTFAGRLVADPKDIPVKGSHGSAFTVAVNRKSNGTSYATFIGCIAFGDVAKAINDHLHKGSSVLITGALSQSKGAKKELQVSVSAAQFLDSAPKPEEVIQSPGEEATA